LALNPSELRSTKNNLPPIAVFYGVGGSGKTELASQFPEPYYLSTMGEEPPENIEMATPGQIESLADVYSVIDWLLTAPHEFKTLIIDSLDGIEPLVWAATIAENPTTEKGAMVSSIEDYGYGKGYVLAEAKWTELLSGLQAIRKAGMAVILIGHEEIQRFDDPTSDPYSRYIIRLQKGASAIVRETAQIVGFINYRRTLKEKDVGFNKKVGHAEGSGEREIHLEERPGFLAKNRYGMPPKVPYKQGRGYEELSKYFPAPTGVSQ